MPPSPSHLQPWPATVVVLASWPGAAGARIAAWRRAAPGAHVAALVDTRMGLRRVAGAWLYPVQRGERASLLQELEAFDADAIDIGLWRHAEQRQGLLPHLRGSPRIVTAPETLPPAPARRTDPAATVSVVMPVFNGADYLEAALATCLDQTHRALELIVVDDGSKDNSRAIAEAWAARDPRLRVFANPQNARVPTTLNRGFAAATGELLTWTSHDNLMQPTAIEALVRFFATYPETDFVYADYRVIDAAGRVMRLRRVPSPDTLGERNGIGPYFMYRRRVYEEVGAFRPGLDFVDDYDYWLRVQRSGAVMRNLHLPLYDYREHKKAATWQLKRDHALQARIDARIRAVQNETLVSWWPSPGER